ncbi:hypothetical protein [Pontibacter vulgaris]|uniref:hypothetical protein n=1 Tax=Pontibacter vulgaris TaxID=2905679 RepID=UPI001FA7072F|nr:hypothetical protein [Pontibacter vulgaris]
MNRDFENNDRPRRNHYADFDEHGNARTGNPNSISRYQPEDRNRADYRNYQEPERGRLTNDAPAYGDFSQGSRYGEGGSTFGSGSAYGNSDYGSSGSRGPQSRDFDRNRSEDVQHGYGHYSDFESRSYNPRGGSDYHGYMSDRRDLHYRGAGYDTRFNPDYGPTGLESTGYDRGFGNYGHTGYGSTGYDNRDLDRERSAYSQRNEANSNYSKRIDRNRPDRDREM